MGGHKVPTAFPVRRVAFGALWCGATLLAGAGRAPAQGDGIHFDCVIEPNAVVALGSPLEGVLAEVAVDRGDTVRAGQPVARLDSRVEYAELAVARARARTESTVQERKALSGLTQRSEARAGDLYARKVISEQVKDQTATDAKVASAQLQLAKELKEIAALEAWRATEAVERRTIRSPIDGIVIERGLSAGERVSEQAILTIAQIDPLRVEAIVPSEHFGKIQPGQRARVLPEPPAQTPHEATVTIVDRIIDPASGTFRVRAQLPNPDFSLPSGLRCQISFSVSGGAVPRPPAARSPEGAP